jgi:ubiquinone/menaquinone biosynthesis C-methylase UbiE
MFIGHDAAKPAREAYDTWAANYDTQPGNLMLDLDEAVFAELLDDISINGKSVADIGCGTGRHWKNIYDKHPAQLSGYDVSAGMLAQLSCKYPNAQVHQITDNRFTQIGNGSFDCLISTLTIAHIKDINEAIDAWMRMLKKGGHIILTDFHPSLLQKGGKRSFSHGGKTVTVRNYAHPVAEVERIFGQHGCLIERRIERYIDEDVRHYYEAKQAVDVYERFKGAPVIYGLLLRKEHEAE